MQFEKTQNGSCSLFKKINIVSKKQKQKQKTIIQKPCYKTWFHFFKQTKALIN